jgi:hypothetical protein
MSKGMMQLVLELIRLADNWRALSDSQDRGDYDELQRIAFQLADTAYEDAITWFDWSRVDLDHLRKRYSKPEIVQLLWNIEAEAEDNEEELIDVTLRYAKEGKLKWEA